MDHINITYIFSAGFRCYSPDALKAAGLRPFSGPFDYMIIDLETVFALMQSQMTPFLRDIVVYNRSRCEPQSIHSLNVLNRANMVGYMAHNYNEHFNHLNTNFLDHQTLSSNMYEWPRICLFHHQNISDKEEHATISRRADRFVKILQDHPSHTCMFHVTRITTIMDWAFYVASMIRMKKSYAVACFVVVVVCCDNMEPYHHLEDNMLFIVKKVDPYAIQINQGVGTDNNLDYEDEINVMKQYFRFDLTPLVEM